MKPISTATLKKRREREGYSQRQLALLCKCTQAAISALECGTMTQCSEDLANQIAKWLRRATSTNSSSGMRIDAWPE